ncbi:uncharacterized protein DS421_2g49990 [Arachis hypogaea]|nr:uncharacterized protein DS421_2g49990 [Arachis hypogaea]
MSCNKWRRKRLLMKKKWLNKRWIPSLRTLPHQMTLLIILWKLLNLLPIGLNLMSRRIMRNLLSI